MLNISFTIIRICIFGLIAVGSLMGIQTQDSVKVYNTESDNGLYLNAINSNLFPVTLEIKLQLENMKPDVQEPYQFVLQPDSDERIMELKVVEQTKAWSYHSEYSYQMGSIFARHNDSFAYRLPFRKGESYKLSQGFGGEFSHKEHQEFALDFNLPEGTPVYAARGGNVVKAEEHFTEGGENSEYLDKANHVTLLHDDGTFADYTHLQYNGVEVRAGQKIRTGQIIGYSGATGFATGPHLHFVVKKAKIGGGFESLPVRFATKDGIQLLEEGNEYLGY